jgi:tripartite-type tricarboxylate transporter receptor subunit TctC
MTSRTPIPFNRRRLLAASLAIGAATAMASLQARAQGGFPDKPVTLVVPFSAGGPVDAVARALADSMGKSTGKTFVVDNRPGANGAIGASQVARSAADGYTVLIGNADINTLNPLISPKLSYAATDFEPVVLFGRLTGVLVARTGATFGNAIELAAAARAKPGTVSWGTWGVGSVPHVVMAMFEQASRTELLAVPYRGAAPAIQDLLGNQLDLFTMTTPMAIDQQKAGRVKILAALTGSRLPALPDVPTMAEQGFPGVVGDTYIGLFVPKGTPRPVIDFLNGEINKALKDEPVAQRFARIGITVEGGTPQQFASYLQSESARWGDIVRSRNIRNQIAE